ncbi:MAG TPA: hypothetical protein VLG76_04785, partial [Rhabdochlamydiaceae bacterium]|nr:hypothetical protein [Rhabdochlamydiaceae bacterium]
MNGVWFPSSPPDSQLKRTYSDSVVPTNYRLSAIDKIYRAQYESFKGNFSLEGSEFEKGLIKFYKSKQKFLWVISRI